MLIVGAIYLVAGLLFADLASSASSHQMVVAWRLAAWVVSAIAFGAHIGYELFRLGNSPPRTALHASLGAAIGALGLAAAASIHALTAATHPHFPAWALVVWPLITAIPAFVVALAVAAVLARTRVTPADKS